MTRWVGFLGMVLLLFLSSAFAALNGDRRVTIDFGLFSLVRIPVTFVVFGALLLGMLIMLAVGVHSDLKVRRIVRRRLNGDVDLSDPAHDRLQQELFGDSQEDPPP